MAGQATWLLGVVPGPGLLFGLMLVAAIVGGHAARFLRLPRVVGFLLGGVGLNAALATLLGTSGNESAKHELEEAARTLKPIKDLALGLILFTIGGIFERSRLRAALHRVLCIGVLESALVLILVFGACWTVLSFGTGRLSVGDRSVLSLLLGIAAIATAPAATLFVLNEYEAKGPVTETILGLTALNNIVCIVLFYVAFLALSAFDVISTTGALSHHVQWALAASTIGSVVLGVLVGTIITLVHARFPLAETMLFFFALFVVLGAGEGWLWKHQGISYSFLLLALVIGGTFANLAVDSQRLDSMLRTAAAPIFAGFFVMAGYELHVDDLGTMGALGAGYVVARVAGKWTGARLGIRWSGGPARAENRLGGALLCQAAVVIGLASFADRYWDSALAARFSAILLGSVVVFELIGPLLVKRCVVQAGEVKAITLLRRPDASRDSRSGLKRVMRGLGRLAPWKTVTAPDSAQVLRVEHLMRTNVQLIPASASFDDVLHEIERSTHSHFPVVHENGEFAGVIHFSDVHDVIYDPSLSQLVTAVDLADADSVVVPADMPIDELFALFNTHKVGVFPVIESDQNRQIVGLVEQRDLLTALRSQGIQR